eukprot:scaffold363010_cov23-Prasinocladus_malaysianus.AAC.1
MASTAMYHCKNEPIKSNVVLCCLPAKRQDLGVSKWTRFHALAKDSRQVSGGNFGKTCTRLPVSGHAKDKDDRPSQVPT